MCSNTLPFLGQYILLQLKSLLEAAFAWGRMKNAVGSQMVFTSQGWHLTHLKELNLFSDQHWLYNLHFYYPNFLILKLELIFLYCWATFLKVVFKAKWRRKKMPGISLRKYSSVSSTFLSKWMVPREARFGCVLSQ